MSFLSEFNTPEFAKFNGIAIDGSEELDKAAREAFYTINNMTTKYEDLDDNGKNMYRIWFDILFGCTAGDTEFLVSEIGDPRDILPSIISTFLSKTEYDNVNSMKSDLLLIMDESIKTKSTISQIGVHIDLESSENKPKPDIVDDDGKYDDDIDLLNAHIPDYTDLDEDGNIIDGAETSDANKTPKKKIVVKDLSKLLTPKSDKKKDDNLFDDAADIDKMMEEQSISNALFDQLGNDDDKKKAESTKLNTIDEDREAASQEKEAKDILKKEKEIEKKREKEAKEIKDQADQVEALMKAMESTGADKSDNIKNMLNSGLSDLLKSMESKSSSGVNIADFLNVKNKKETAAASIAGGSSASSVLSYDISEAFSLMSDESSVISDLGFNDFEYEGFDARYTLNKFAVTFEEKTKKLGKAEFFKNFNSLTALVLVRGTNYDNMVERTKESGKAKVDTLLKAFGITKGGGVSGKNAKKDALILSRVTSCNPIGAARILAQGSVEPKTASSKLPVWLHFSGAAALIHPDDEKIYEEYINWATKFDKFINGKNANSDHVKKFSKIAIESDTVPTQKRKSLKAFFNRTAKSYSSDTAKDILAKIEEVEA
jgi:hypothetical protein